MALFMDRLTRISYIVYVLLDFVYSYVAVT